MITILFTTFLTTVIFVAAVSSYSVKNPFRRVESLISTKADRDNLSGKERKPWEFGRFLNTVRFYNGLRPNLRFLSSIFKSKESDSKSLSPGSVVWSKTNLTQDWGPLDDVVMGGVSRSYLNIGDKFTGNWTGYVSTDNNGGFAGIRTKVFSTPLDASNSRGIILRLKGDGQRYKCILRDTDEWNGIAWSKSFDTTINKVIDVKIPFSGLIPTKFAKTVALTTSFNKNRISAIQLTLSKFEYDGGLNPNFREGRFELQLESIVLF